MSIPAPYQQYQQNAVLGAAPEQLTLMLYNGAAKFINLAVQAVDKRDITGAHNAIVRAQDIILHLMDTLNEEFVISGNLAGLYDYMHRRLIEANAKKDPEILREVKGMAEELKDTWDKAVKLARSGPRG